MKSTVFIRKSTYLLSCLANFIYDQFNVIYLLGLLGYKIDDSIINPNILGRD